jgi:hypothetical protein
MVACIAVMVSAIAYAFIRLYVMNLRVDLSIFLVNVVIFSAGAIFLIYLVWKDRQLEEEELFRD